MILLEEAKVRSLLRMEELIPAMAEAMRDLSLGKVAQPLRTIVPVTDHAGFFGIMPASSVGSRSRSSPAAIVEMRESRSGQSR